MASVVLDRDILGRLESSRRRVEVLDEQGCLHGFFVPVDHSEDQQLNPVSQNELTLPAGVIVPFNQEEIRQALAEPGGRSLREILTDLRARP